MLQAQTASLSSNAPAADTTRTTRPMVMLLEDNADNSEPLIELLNHYGFDVRLARTLLEAMPLLMLAPRYAILDLILPDGGGERILDLIRRRKLDTQVTILTASRDRERLREAARLKPDLMLTKPLDLFRLLEFMRTRINPG